MRAARAILLYALGVLLIGALLAPCLYGLVHPHWPHIPFKRVFDRALLGAALVGLWPLLRALEIRSWTELGYPARSGWWCQILLGMGLGIASLAVAGSISLLLGGRRLETGAGVPFGQLGLFLLMGLAVGVVEETFFRGGLFGALRKGMGLWPAVLLSSAVYSIVHFLKSRGAKGDDEIVTWVSGFQHLAQVGRDLLGQPGLAAGFITLLLAGIILAVAFTRTRALYLSIGLHAGWVFMIKSFSALTEPTGPRQWWNGTSLVDSATDWPVLLVTLVVVDYLCRKKFAPKQA